MEQGLPFQICVVSPGCIMPDTALGSQDTGVHKTKGPALRGLPFQAGKLALMHCGWEGGVQPQEKAESRVRATEGDGHVTSREAKGGP